MIFKENKCGLAFGLARFFVLHRGDNMAYILNEDTWEKTTAEAQKRYSYLESVGYLHSDYNRFEEISDYKSVYYTNVINKLGKAIIKKQKERERAIYNELGVNDIDGLNELFKGDAAIQTFVNGTFNNLVGTVAEALANSSWDRGNLKQLMAEDKKRDIEHQIEQKFQKSLDGFTDEYKTNLNKILDNKGLSAEMLPLIKNISIFKDGELRTANSFAYASLGQWKGDLLEQCLAMCIAQLGKVKNVKVTGSDLDQFDKFIKSDVTVSTENMNIGLSAKNYKTIIDNKGNIIFDNDLALHGGSTGTYFENFLQRMESLKNDDFQGNINTITKRLRTDNYYYNLINEAAQKFSFKSSDPATDFIAIVKGLAAAWFGTQLITDTKEGNRGQNVDFFVVGKYGFIPMSSILQGLMNESASLSVNVNSTTNLNMDNIYDEKVQAEHGKRMYSGEEVGIGIDAGSQVYDKIKVSPIKLKMILNQFITV